MTDISSSRHIAQVELFSEAHRITARVALGSTGLLGLLNDSNVSLLDIEDAYISRWSQPARMSGSFDLGGQSKASLTLALTTRREEMGPSGMLRSGYTKPNAYNIIAGVGLFEIRAVAEMPGKLDLPALTTSTNARFVVLFEATVNHVLYPDYQFSGPALAVNRAFITYVAAAPKGKG